jgi:hypothetical protein
MAREPRMSTNSPTASSKPNGATRVRPVTAVDRRAASRKYAGLARTLDRGGEEALQAELDKSFPGTRASRPRNPMLEHRGRAEDLGERTYEQTHIVPEPASSAPAPRANPERTPPGRRTDS